MSSAQYAQLPADDDPNNAIEEQQVSSRQANAWAALSPRETFAVISCFGLLGAGVLLPFNALITPSGYFQACFSGTPFAQTFASWMVIAYNVSTIVFSAHATATLEKTTPSARLYLSGSLIFGCLLAFTVSTQVGSEGSSSSSLYFYFVVLLSTLLASATAYFQNAVVALAASFGARCMGAMIAFQGVVGAVISLVQLVTAVSLVKHQEGDASISASLDSKTAKSAAVFFAFSTALMAMILFAFHLLTGSHIYAEVDRGTKEAKAVSNEGLASSSFDRLLGVQRKIAPLCFSVAYVFVVTLALFPAFTARVTSSSAITGSLMASPLVFSAVHFLVFNTADLVGRTLPSLLPARFIPERSLILVLASLARTIFAPLFNGCHTEPSHGADSMAVREVNASPSLLQADWVFFSLLALFGVSNGYISTSLFLVAPARPQLRPDERQLAATVLSFWLTIGLAVGSALSLATASW